MVQSPRVAAMAREQLGLGDAGVNNAFYRGREAMSHA